MLRCLEEGRTRGHDVLWLGVWERNARAQAFYSRWGFTEVGEMRFLLGDDLQRDLVLALALRGDELLNPLNQADAASRRHRLPTSSMYKSIVFSFAVALLIGHFSRSGRIPRWMPPTS
ncbi:hypothetical protein POL68_01175 [Stigmatella sp. ncwal1]|uniref:N-acetyltransferase domain-containing protein n=1 Tax=Stigmatella ashevillensis TaxID=2995309 RepID=A0ABT5D490_9BACT|nr:hypothetical protein [Stigmatella ashevillena]MDC0707071.1 hypothetical protein [Stigmatella ashevillena]